MALFRTSGSNSSLMQDIHVTLYSTANPNIAIKINPSKHDYTNYIETMSYTDLITISRATQTMVNRLLNLFSLCSFVKHNNGEMYPIVAKFMGTGLPFRN